MQEIVLNKIEVIDISVRLINIKTLFFPERLFKILINSEIFHQFQLKLWKLNFSQASRRNLKGILFWNQFVRKSFSGLSGKAISKIFIFYSTPFLVGFMRFSIFFYLCVICISSFGLHSVIGNSPLTGSNLRILLFIQRSRNQDRLLRWTGIFSGFFALNINSDDMQSDVFRDRSLMIPLLDQWPRSQDKAVSSNKNILFFFGRVNLF